MNKKKVKWLIIISVGVLLIFGLIAKKKGIIGNDSGLDVSVEKPQRRNITEIITANGKIQPETEVKISPDVSGEIIDLLVKEGDEVRENDILLRIQPDIYLSGLERMDASLNTTRANLANAKARLAQTEAQYEQAKVSFQRSEKLWKDKTISDSQYEDALAQYNVQKANVEAAKQDVSAGEFNVKSADAARKEAKDNLNKTTIYSPMTGTVSMLNIEKGERVVGTKQMAGTEMLRIANLNKMEVLVDVNENDIVRVSLNDTALIEVDAYLDKKFKGIVTEIANSAKIEGVSADQVTNFEVKILILYESYKDLIPAGKTDFYPFRPGMSATVDIQTETRKNVLSVPIQSITTRMPSDTSIVIAQKTKDVKETDENEENEEDSKSADNKKDELLEIIFLSENGKAVLKEVKTGIQDNNYIEILSGIDDKIDVITGPYRVISKTLTNGQKINVVDKSKLFETH